MKGLSLTGREAERGPRGQRRGDRLLSALSVATGPGPCSNAAERLQYRPFTLSVQQPQRLLHPRFLEVFFALMSTGWGDDGAQGLRSCSHILNIVGIGKGTARSPDQGKKIDGGRDWALGSLPSTAYLPCGVCLDRGPWGADLAIVSFGCWVLIPAG